MVGDIYTDMQYIADSSYLEVKPAAGREMVLHNIYHENTVTLKMVDGSGNLCAFLDEAGKNFLTNMYVHVSNTQYLRIYNISGGSIYIAVDGVVTKEP